MPDWMPGPGEMVGGAVLLYLLLLARSARKQGEFKQFLWGLVIVIGIIGIIGGVIWGWIALKG
ncbi:hypothetical protein GE253_19715 [Niveispirillum sp. SYP-B3756]|uniref:hypothetical protein n=1 Tax=Niveispirillum sp. SYP-B3756 TaxID=2662178 RepID=UPI001291F09E|nr:hypothetical protein [Niveispirillum sp. SYP-B3756]MQP67557.1 hypothetical protein [Niveispirillum sp. SYP-B3756]